MNSATFEEAVRHAKRGDAFFQIDMNQPIMMSAGILDLRGVQHHPIGQFDQRRIERFPDGSRLRLLRGKPVGIGFMIRSGANSTLKKLLDSTLRAYVAGNTWTLQPTYAHQRSACITGMVPVRSRGINRLLTGTAEENMRVSG